VVWKSMWLKIPGTGGRLSFRQGESWNPALYQSSYFIDVPSARSIHSHPKASLGSRLDQLVGDQINDPRLRIRRQSIRGRQTVPEDI